MEGAINDGLLRAWYCFPEVKQNRLGFCLTRNSGRGLGMSFAQALNENLQQLFTDFREERKSPRDHTWKNSF